MEQFVHALFPNRERAAAAVDALVNANFPPPEIGALIANDRMEVQELVVERKTIITRGVILGILIGAAGGVLVLAALGLINTGISSQAIEAVALGGAFGALCGTLGGLGYWRNVIDFPRDAFRQGAVLVGVNTHAGRVDEARVVLALAGARRTHVCSKNGAVLRALAWASTQSPFLSVPKHST